MARNQQMTNYYEAAKVDTLLKSAANTMRALNEVLKMASDENKQLTAEVNRLKAATAGQPSKVILEKVANHPSESKIDDFVSTLINHAIVREADREKFATACRENPDNLLDIATHALKLSESPVPQGSGYYGEKAAAKSKLTPDQETKRSLEREARIWEKVKAIGEV